jgi:hypothetical protein
MARAGKKTLWEDDVRQLLGMPPTESALQAADTSLEKAFSVSKPKQSQQMSMKSDSKGYQSLDDEAGFRFSKKLMITVALIFLAIAGAFIIVDEAGQASRSDVTQQGLNSQAARGRLRSHPSQDSSSRGNIDDEVVGRGNWKDLQRKADEEKRKERAMQLHGSSPKGRHPRLPRHRSDANSDSEADDSHSSSIEEVQKGMERVGGANDARNRGARASTKAGPPGGWVKKNGGPHRGAKSNYGAGIFDW